MRARDAYDIGFDNGYGAGKFCDMAVSDQKEAECDCYSKNMILFSNDDGLIMGVSCRKCVERAALNAEDNLRQYSPFEFTAQEMNEDEDRADMLWDHYDRGVAAGIKHGMKGRFQGRRKNVEWMSVS